MAKWAEEKYLKLGCPDEWPQLHPRAGETHPTPLLEKYIGSFRNPEDTVIVDVRSKYHSPQPGPGESCLKGKGLTFLEAGPRQTLLHGVETPLNVGILVSGGIAPGINAVIAGLIETISLPSITKSAIAHLSWKYLLTMVDFHGISLSCSSEYIYSPKSRQL